MATKRKTGAKALPKGFQNLNERAPAWTPEVGDELQGVVVAKKELDAKKAGRKKAKKGETVRILTVTDETAGEVVNVWESHALKELCDKAKPGDRVYLRLDEIVKRGSKRFKNFAIGFAPKSGK